MRGPAGDGLIHPWSNAGMDHCPNPKSLWWVGGCCWVWDSYPIHLTNAQPAPSWWCYGVFSLSSPDTFSFCRLLIWVSPGSGTHKSLGNEHDNPRPHMQSLWQGCTELKRSLEVDQLSHISQLPLAISPFKMEALSSCDSLEQGTILQALTVPAYNRSGRA